MKILTEGRKLTGARAHKTNQRNAEVNLVIYIYIMGHHHHYLYSIILMLVLIMTGYVLDE
jgi:hypothetical protein